MPPKRTRAKKSVKEEDDLPSMSGFLARRVDVNALFSAGVLSSASDFGEMLNQNLHWVYGAKEELKQKCEEFGGSKAVPKTPKRECAFSKIKDTINMFDNLALTRVPPPPPPQRLHALDIGDDEDNDDHMGGGSDEVFEEATQNEPTDRTVKTDHSPVPTQPQSLLIQQDREVKEEVISDEEEEHPASRRERSTKEDTSRTPAPASRAKSGSIKPGARTHKTTEASAPSTTQTDEEGAADVYPPVPPPRATKSPTRTPKSSYRTTHRHTEDDLDMEDPHQIVLPQTRVHTPSRNAIMRVGRSPARGAENGRAAVIKKAAARMNGEHSDSNHSSPSKNHQKNDLKAAKEKEERDGKLKKLEDRAKAADAAREEQIRERAERLKKGREERELKVKAKKGEEEKERERRKMEMKEKERQVKEMKQRQAASPSRGGERMLAAKTPTRLRLGNSPEGGRVQAMKRTIQSPLTPHNPVKKDRIHSTKKVPIPLNLNESEDDEVEREREREKKRREMEKRRKAEEEARLKSVKEEKERLAKLKEEERRREEERERREKEKMEREREKERVEREKEEEAVKKMKTPVVLKNKHLANASMNESNSYDMTPDKVFVPATETNYGVDDLDSGDETDDEENPRKKVPKWASGAMLTRTISLMRHNPPFDPDVFFGPIIQPDLNLIFKPSSKYPKRTSSAMWNSPLSNPTKGKSRFFNN